MRARWAHDFADRHGETGASLLGSGFPVVGTRVGRNAAPLGGGGIVLLGGSTALFADYDAELRENATAHRHRRVCAVW